MVPGIEAEINETEELAFDVESFEARFPRSTAHLGLDLAGMLLGATRSVGMVVPGLHSLIVDVTVAAPEGTGGPEFHTESVVTAVRVRPVDVHLSSGTLTGRVRAMFRPAPVDQPPYEDFEERFAGERLEGWRAWVVGGSRGIGEALAKYLAAGGAAVTVTYSRGAEDAHRVQEEISAGGGRCDIAHVDVLDPGWADRVVAERPSHVFYLCSPKILPHDRNTGGAAAAFQDYIAFYVTGLFALADALAGTAEPVRIYFPSSVYVGEPKEGFFEYTAAKRMAEQLGADLTA